MATQTYQHMITSLIQSSTDTAVLLLALEEACLEPEQTVELVSSELSHPSLLPSIRQATVSERLHPACYCLIQVFKVTFADTEHTDIV
ncbi:hypothetical protein AV530_019616 [Patagioenas fasciata monilis]|uniref:Uncharacterized protein n=1 Tax=Patagioenas fasciata monilis TaxID=372326 RepID=A0A1V4JFC5_PATFA|nr:hypothetical protein AV530_019616 [Patagioenas fasciata monilis]